MAPKKRDHEPPVVTTYEDPQSIRKHWGQQWLGTFNPPPPPQTVVTPPPVHHPVLSNDKVEHDLLAAIRARPDDEHTRAVYADWLEQHGHATRAKFVRDEDLEIKRIVKESTPAWRAITSRAVIPMCWSETCPRRWHRLQPTPDENVRRCGECNKSVRFLPRKKKNDDDGSLECFWRGEEWVLDVDWHQD